MATIESYTNAAGKTRYMVRFRTPAGAQSKKRGIPTKKAAEDFAATVETDKMTGTYISPSLGTITVGELAAGWLARKQLHTAPSHSRMLVSAFKVHVAPTWAAVKVADIDVLGVETWIATMASKGAGATTVLRAYGVLSGILTDAVKAKR
jgi:hypothetical protein